MQITLGRMRLRIDLLMLLAPCIAVFLGEGRITAILFLSLIVHECAHLIAARILHIPVHTLRLTPFGAMAQIMNPYAIQPARLFAVSSAGPLGSLLMILLSAALCHWHILDPLTAADLIQINTLLMLFNLIPALPLDGGRMLYAALAAFLPRRLAAETGIWSGRALAAILIGSALYGFMRHHILNLSTLICALFLIASANDERSALTDSKVRTLIDSLRPLREPLPVSIVAIDSQIDPEIALRAAIPGRITLFALFDRGCFTGFRDESTLLHSILYTASEANKKSQKI